MSATMAETDRERDRYVRIPQHDRRIGSGDDFAGDAWLDTETGQIVYSAVGLDRKAMTKHG